MAADQGCTPLNLINDDKDDWKIRVKVFLAWKQIYLNNPTQFASMEMILMDQQGNKIIASMKRFLIPEFEDTLKEGNFVDLSEFGVEPYKGDYRLIDHAWKINLFRSSKVRRCPSFEPAIDGYNLVPFDDVLEWKVPNIFGFDIVGHLVSIKPMHINRESGKESKSVEFELKDIAGKKVNCNVWGEHAMQLQDFIARNKQTSDHVIIMIQNAKLKMWQSNPQVSNQLFGARLHINTEVSPIVDFKAGLLNRDDLDITPTQLTDLAHDTVINTALNYYLKPPLKTVDQVRATVEVSDCVVKATVKRFLIEEGWFTYACKSCKKKAHRRLLDCGDVRVFDCQTCGMVKEVIGKLRTVVKVEDVTGSTSLIMFDNQLSKLLNKSVSWLNKKIETVDDPYVLPMEFNALLNKEAVFKIHVGEINVKFGYSAYTVHRGTEDADVLTAITVNLNDRQTETVPLSSIESTPTAKVHTLIDDDILSIDSAKQITPIPFSLKRKSESPPDCIGNDASTSNASKSLASLKIARMEDI